MTGTTDNMRGAYDYCTEAEHTSSMSTLAGTFLNFESPVQHRGTVSSWEYCYYRAIGNYNMNDMFRAKIMVYRQNPSHSNQYDQVSESVTSLSIKWKNIHFSYNCCSKTKNFKILENDIIGACINYHGSGNPLHLVEANEDFNLSTYQFSQEGYERCTQTQVKKIDIRSGGFIRRPTIFLHVYPEIIPGECGLNNLNVSFFF